MPELRQLRDLTGQVRPPELDQLAVLADRRSRRTAGAVAAGVATSLVLATVITAGALREHDRSTGPVGPHPDPSPTATFPVLSAEQIRNHPDAVRSSDGDFPATASDVAARVWSVCLGECTRATEHLPGELQSALEVSRDGFEHSALYALDQTGNISHVVDDWYFVAAHSGPVLVDSRGHRRAVRSGGAVPVAAVAGPLVYSTDGLAYLDLEARTLHVVQREGDASWDWFGAADSWFWGCLALVEETTFTRQAAVWRRPDGTFGVKVLPIGNSSGGSGMLRAGTPGTMAVVEHFARPRLAHINTDYGETWQVRQVPGEVDSGGRLPPDWRTWPPG
jgi:hypothetical protein